MYEFNKKPREVKKIHTINRHISGMLPIPEQQYYFDKLEKNQPKSNDILPRIIWESAENFSVYSGGNKFIDFTSGIFVANTGHNNPEIKKAIQRTSYSLLHSYLYPNVYSINLAEQLVNLVKKTNDKIDKCLLLSTGSEANEIAIKLVRSYGMKQNPDKKLIIGFKRDFHGKSAFARLIGGTSEATKWTGVYANDVGIYNFDFPINCLDDFDVEESSSEMNRKYQMYLFMSNFINLSFKDINPEDIAGFFIEPYQGWNATFFPKIFIQLLCDYAKKIGALVVVDEIQAGMGRTGKLFAHEYFDIQPDIITCGKGLSSGLPISAILARDELFGDDLGYTSTHCNNPVCSASAIANIDYLLRHKLIEKAYKQGKWVKNELSKIREKYPNRIVAIQGAGAVWAMIFCKPKTIEFDIEFCDRIVERCFEKGLLLIRTMAGTIKLGYPLTILDDALLEGLQVIDESIEELIKEGY